MLMIVRSPHLWTELQSQMFRISSKTRGINDIARGAWTPRLMLCGAPVAQIAY